MAHLTNRAKVWKALKLASDPLSVKEICTLTSLTYDQTRVALQGLKNKGLVMGERDMTGFNRWNDRPQRWLVVGGDSR